MPYKILKKPGSRPFKIIKKETGKVVGTSKTKIKALASMRARYAAEKAKQKGMKWPPGKMVAGKMMM